MEWLYLIGFFILIFEIHVVSQNQSRLFEVLRVIAQGLDEIDNKLKNSNSDITKDYE